jgi:hypothetical protein
MGHHALLSTHVRFDAPLSDGHATQQSKIIGTTNGSRVWGTYISHPSCAHGRGHIHVQAKASMLIPTGPGPHARIHSRKRLLQACVHTVHTVDRVGEEASCLVGTSATGHKSDRLIGEFVHHITLRAPTHLSGATHVVVSVEQVSVSHQLHSQVNAISPKMNVSVAHVGTHRGRYVPDIVAKRINQRKRHRQGRICSMVEYVLQHV